MLEQLLKYDINTSPKEIKYQDIDITDKTVLEIQINTARKSFFDLIAFQDSLQSDKANVKNKIVKIRQEIMRNFPNKSERSDQFYLNEDLQELEDTNDALNDAISIIKLQIDLAKTDLRLLGNSQYSKF